MKTYHFLSGLPRSGSTVLASILNQNPSVYVTPTSPLLDQLVSNQNIWHSLQTVKANPEPVQLDNVTKSIINMFWNHIDKPIIIDKNRGWGKNMPAAEFLFNKPMKMIACVRDIPAIMASWLTLLRNNSGGKMDQILFQKGLLATDENRMTEMWDNMVRDCVESINQALKDAPNQVHVVEYDDLVVDPEQILFDIETFLNIPHHSYDFHNIQSVTNDDDLSAWGLNGMHKIRGQLKNTSRHPKDVLGEKIYNKFDFEWRT